MGALDAVAAADQAGAAAYAPRSARSFLGDVYIFAKRWSDALAAYQSALSIPRASHTSDLGTGEILAKIAIAQVNLGDLAAADRSAESQPPHCRHRWRRIRTSGRST